MGRQHAPNKQCVLNNDVCQITRFYGMLSRLKIRPGNEVNMSVC